MHFENITRLKLNIVKFHDLITRKISHHDIALRKLSSVTTQIYWWEMSWNSPNLFNAIKVKKYQIIG